MLWYPPYFSTDVKFGVLTLNDQIEKDPAELVQIEFLKWLLGVNKYCSNNACRAETGRFPMKIEAQYRNFKFWLTLTKHLKHKLSQVVYNDIKSRMNKELWSQKIKRVLDQLGLGYLWTKAQENDIGILNNIKQRLKDVELQRWLSDVNNDVRKDANQKNKLRTLPENLKQSKIINVKIISIRSPTSDTR